MTEYGHKPVLLAEVLDGLKIRPDGSYVDCTFGRGGHSRAILQRLDENGRLLLMDKDEQAINFAGQHYAQDSRVLPVHTSFEHLREVLERHKRFGQVAGILLDLGVSSPQLDDPERGFSFQKQGGLDMRMNTADGITAKDWLKQTPVREMMRVFREYGEEKFARRIATAIDAQRQESDIETTTQLAELIQAVVPSRERDKHPATRVFQAIRIAVNRELEELEAVLPQCVDALGAQGRLLVISFHSLEDRIVKRFFRQQEIADPYPKEIPVKAAQIRPRLIRIGDAIKAGAEELQANPRARSAVLRIAERTAV
ncbi:MAG: 16S rRNA (cytosine(1402)-N(4))-methyltransferase RsmH [Gammaproteobacteria bacterium]